MKKSKELSQIFQSPYFCNNISKTLDISNFEFGERAQIIENWNICKGLRKPLQIFLNKRKGEDLIYLLNCIFDLVF